MRGEAITRHERLRIRAILDAVTFSLFGLDYEDARHVLSGCDLPCDALSGPEASRLNAKGFWRLEKSFDPELRHSVLALIALHELNRVGIEAFLSQNDGQGWLLPETIQLSEFGLGHDKRAQTSQPVAARIGPRFLARQDIEPFDAASRAHAEQILRILPLTETGYRMAEGPVESRATAAPLQGGLF